MQKTRLNVLESPKSFWLEQETCSRFHNSENFHSFSKHHRGDRLILIFRPSKNSSSNFGDYFQLSSACTVWSGTTNNRRQCWENHQKEGNSVHPFVCLCHIVRKFNWNLPRCQNKLRSLLFTHVGFYLNVYPRHKFCKQGKTFFPTIISREKLSWAWIFFLFFPWQETRLLVSTTSLTLWKQIISMALFLLALLNFSSTSGERNQ